MSELDRLREIHALIAAKISVSESGCWEWTANRNQGGYGVAWLNGRHEKAHRAVYTLLRSGIAPGMQLDHLCRNRGCVNPGHLDPVSARENTRRSPIAPGAINGAKTHCKRGHEFTPENTYKNGPSGRQCRTCAIRSATLGQIRRRAERKQGLSVA